MQRIGSLRHKLVKQACGDVLEVASGTGRNFRYYDEKNVKTLIVTDMNREMLKTAASKKDELRNLKDKTRFVLCNASKLEQFESAQFDTIVDTFGVCSFEKPIEALTELRRLLKQDGTLLLLEHGKSTWSHVNHIMHERRTGHLKQHGCYWDRDILELVETAGFKPTVVKRKQLGTLYYIVAKVSHVETVPA